LTACASASASVSGQPQRRRTSPCLVPEQVKPLVNTVNRDLKAIDLQGPGVASAASTLLRIAASDNLALSNAIKPIDAFDGEKLISAAGSLVSSASALSRGEEAQSYLTQARSLVETLRPSIHASTGRSLEPPK
jgi:hypothetical protein